MKHTVLQFKQSVQRNKLFFPTSKLLVAVSGGLDSMVLCSLLLEMKCRVELAHMNYGLRADESEADADFIQEFAVENGLVLHLKRAETKKESRKRKTGIQETARTLRYAWFNELLDKHSLDYIVTAHHADDQAETIFHHFIRGSGLRGMGGMKIKDGKLIRPLLIFSKEELKLFALEKKIEWREDSSNQLATYTRNRIRNEVFPLLNEIHPGFSKAIVSNAAVYREAEKRLHDELQSELSRMVHKDGDDEVLSTTYLKSAPSPLLFLHEWLGRKGFSTDQLKQVLALTQASSGKEVHSIEYTVTHDRRRLVLHRNQEEEAMRDRIHAPGEGVERPVQLTSSKVSAKAVRLDASKEEAFLDLDTLVFPLVVRRWGEGDTFRPLGMTGRQKVSDFLQQQKVPVHKKKMVCVLESGGEICWVIGYRIGHKYRWKSTSKAALHLVYRKK